MIDWSPYYAVLPYVGRMDDIWGSYILQHYFPNSVVYKKASVYQDRNVQDLITNLENKKQYACALKFIESVYDLNETIGIFGVSTSEMANTSGLNHKAAHTGWVVRTEGTGGRAGRVQYETLVAMGSIQNDASNDTAFPGSGF